MMYPPGLVCLSADCRMGCRGDPCGRPVYPMASASNGATTRVATILQPSLPDENRLRDHAVDALGAVDHLGDVIIHGDARDHVGLLARQLGEALGDEADRLAHRNPHGLLKVRVEAHDDPM